MATRSVIAAKNNDGSYTGIYCHWDGYPEHQMPILQNYKTPEMVDALIALGSLSVLGKTLGGKQDFEKPDKDACLAYHRDRGEEFDQIYAMAKEELVLEAGQRDAEYLYTYFGQVWLAEKL